MTFTTKDSGKRAEFASGMVRDTDDGKARFDLLVPDDVPYADQLLTRCADLMARGAVKYCRNVPVALPELVDYCTCGNRIAIHTGLTTLAAFVEAATRKICGNETPTTRSANERTRDSGASATEIASGQSTSPTGRQRTHDATSSATGSSDGPLWDLVLTLAERYWSPPTDSVQYAATSSGPEAPTSTMITSPASHEDFSVLVATRVWASSAIRSRVFGEHSTTCRIRRLRPTSDGIVESGARNWEQADSREEWERMRSSAFRHFMQWMAGEDDEDHAAAVVFNLLAAETTAYKHAEEW